MRRRPRLVGFLWRWHRRVGLLAALLALLLALTGIALNHTSDLALDRRFVEWPWLYRLYGDGAPALPAFRAGERWLYRSGTGEVYLDAQAVATCRGELVGALAADGMIWAACAEELLLLTGRGELVESILAATGLPTPVTGVGLAGASPVLRADGRWRLADPDQLEFEAPVPGGSAITQVVSAELPPELQRVLPTREAWLSWERLLLDLHSGRLGGRFGVWLVDAAGLMFCLLGLSGVAMWWLHHRGGRRPRAQDPPDDGPGSISVR